MIVGNMVESGAGIRPEMKALYHTLTLLLLALLLAAGSARALDKWIQSSFDGVDYVNLRDVCQFYGFTPKQGRPGYTSYGAGNRVLSLRAGKHDFYVNAFRYILSYPVREHAGALYISSTDMQKLVDPVLRPKLGRAENITTVVLDPGHGGHDAGAKGLYALEKDCNLALALKVRDKLKRAGFRVVMTRDADFFLTLQQRVDIANRVPNSLFVSIHHNSGGRAAAGIETFTLAPHGTTSPFARTRRTEELSGNNQDSENIALATAVHAHAIKKTAAPDRGIQRARFSVLCTIRRPAILFEGGFVTHPQEGQKVANPSYQDILAQCICDGIVRYRDTARKHTTQQPQRYSAPTQRPSAGRPLSSTPIPRSS